MKSTAFAVLAAGIALVACRDESSLSKQQQQYEVVQEGVATGANTPLTSSVPPVTATGVDTTTAFQLPGATATVVSAQTGTLPLPPPNVGVGGVLPTQPTAQAAPQRTASAPARSAQPVEAPRSSPTLTGGFSRPPAVQPRPPQNPVPAEPEPVEEPAEDPQEEPAETGTEEPEAAPPPSDTTSPPGAQRDDDSREG